MVKELVENKNGRSLVAVHDVTPLYYTPPPYTVYTIEELLSSTSSSSPRVLFDKDELMKQLTDQIYESFDTFMMEEPNDTTFGYPVWLSIVKGMVGNKNRRTLIAIHDVTHQIIGSVSADVSDDIVGMGE